MIFRSIAAALLIAGAVISPAKAAKKVHEYDVVVYGGTSAGIAAAVQVHRMGKSVAIVEPFEHLGGLTTGGLGATDIGNKAAIGGVSREFYRDVGSHYAKEDSWVYQKKEEYKSRRQSGENEFWTFEPHVAMTVYEQWLERDNIPVYTNHRLELKTGVTKDGTAIQSFRTEDGVVFKAKMFIDATYEGDLLATAGVSYTVGREANSTYGESLNGVQTKMARFHQFTKKVDPYLVPGMPESGLLPGVHGGDPGKEGSGDKGVQAYCFRMCTTDVPENRVAWPKPKNYDPLRYELLLRNCEAGDLRRPWNPVWMPNRKTDTNNNFAISTDNIGMNYEYPDADYAKRAEIIAEHENYQKGLMWTLANHPRVPEELRKHFQNLGLAKDEFVENGNWPTQLYVREARRMVSDYVMTQNDCQDRVRAEDSVGLGAYGMDSHHIQRYVKDGYAFNEGDVQVHGFAPYPISYRSIVPKKGECSNLLVPVCVSSSHIAFGSIRMEPVFMVLGQSAATAAVHAIEEGVDVQNIDYAKLKERLLADKQVLEWTGYRPNPPIDLKKVPGIAVDDANAKLVGEWSSSRSVGGFVGQSYLHDADKDKGSKSATFTFKVKEAGNYEVRLAYTASSNRATNVPVSIETREGTVEVKVNQKKQPTIDKAFVSLGTFELASGEMTVTVSNAKTNGHVIVDAITLVPAK